jgi:hypothetical protein
MIFSKFINELNDHAEKVKVNNSIAQITVKENNAASLVNKSLDFKREP